MGKQNPGIALAKHTDGPAARADGHLHHVPTLQPALSPAQRELADALVIPGRIGRLPTDAGTLGHDDIVSAVAPSGLIANLRENASQVGLDTLSAACSSAANRQRFIGRERWHTAQVAAERIQSATGRHATALGSLAAMHLVYPNPASRLRGEIRFLMPNQCTARARLASIISPVKIHSQAVPGWVRRARRTAPPKPGINPNLTSG